MDNYTSNDLYLDIFQKEIYPVLEMAKEALMRHTAKLFRNGRSQAVRLPAHFRFEGSEVYVRRDPRTLDVILSRRPESWEMAPGSITPP